MKRFLSLVLTVVMLLSTLSSLAFTVSATGDVQSISYTLAKPLEIIEGCGEFDYWYGENEDEEKQEWCYYEYYGQEGDILTVTYTDGSSVDYVYDFYDYEDSEGNRISSWNLWDSDQEFNNQWTAGNSYEFRLSYMGKQTTVPVTIVENPIEAIYFEPDLASVVAISENEFNSEWFWSNINEQIVPRGSVFVVEYKNGEKVEFEAAHYEDSWSSGNGDGFYIVCCNGDDESWVDCWAPHYDPDYENIAFGEEYELTFRYMGKKFNHTISFVDYESSLESIEFIPAKPYEFIENSGGYFEDWYNPETEEWQTKYFYDEYRIDNEGNILTVNFTDGRSVDYISTEYNDWEDSEGNSLYGSPDCYDYQSINPWTIDGENYFVVKYMNKEVQVPVSVIENPVESISYTPAGTTNWIEYDEEYGYHDYYDYYDPETHNGYSCDWFRYEYNKTEGDILTVNNKDGSTVEFIYDGWAYISSDGSEISKKEVKISDNQSYHNQWTAGNTYDINVSYSGFTTTFSVNIIENPVESISYTINKPIEIFEYSNGYWDEDEETYYYSLPTLSDYIEKITLNYNDGTTEDFIWDEDEWEYCNSDGEYLDYSLQATQGDEPWVLGGDNSFKIVTCGREVDIPVTIIENPVESVSYTMSHPIEIIENTNGYWDEREYYDEENDEWVYEDYYSYNFEHISSYIEKFTLNYTDGTTEDFIWNEDEGQYCNADGEYLEYSQEIRQWKDPWVIGGDNNFKVIVYGKEAEVPVTIIENPVASVSYTPSEPIELLENIDGTWWEVTYSDGREYEYFEYYTSKNDICKNGDILTVTYTDGTVTEYVCSLPDEDDSDGYGVFFTDSEGNELPESSALSFSDNQSEENPWTVGNEYEITVSYLGKESTVPVSIVDGDSGDEPEDIITDLVINEEYTVPSGTTKTFIPEESGYYRFTSNGYGDPKISISCMGGEYSFDDHDGLDFDGIVYLEAGESVSCYLYNYEGENSRFVITKEDNEDFGDDDDEEVEKSIVSCSFSLAEPLVLYKGYHLNDDGYFIDVYEDGNIFTMHYSDGSEVNYIFGFNENLGYSDWFNERGDSLNGYIDATALDSENWDVGEHTVTLKYKDYEYDDKYEMEIEVSLIENPVESISVNLSGAIEFIEGEDSYFRTDSKGNFYNYYNPSKWDIPYGSTLTVNYKDGSKEKYTLNEVMDIYDMQYYPTFETADGKILKDYDWIVDSDEKINHWYLGENYLTLSVYGVSAQLPVWIKENNVESFSIDYGSEIVYKQGTNCWAESDYIDKGSDTYLVEYDMYEYWLGENGWELTVNYKDGTSDIFVCTVYEDYETGSRTQWRNASGERLDVEWRSDQSYDNQWGIGTHYVTVGCLGKIMQIPIKIVANDDCGHIYENGFCTICKEEDPSYPIPTLGVGESKTVTISNSGESNYFYFTPAKSGVYSFSVPYFASEDETNYDAVTYDSNFTGIKSRVRWSSDCKEIYSYFEAGEKYIIKCNYGSSSETGSFEISCNCDFYTGEGTNIVENYMFIPCFKTAVADFVTVSDEIEFNCTASFVTATSNYYGTGSQFSYSIGDNTPGYTIIVEGDLNGDSVCDVIDAAVAQLYSAGFYEPTKNETYAANGDLIDEFDVNSYQNVVNCVLSS